MSDIHLLVESDLYRFLRRLAPRFRLFAPVERNGDLVYSAFPFLEERLRVAKARSVEPLKAFLFPARQKVAEDFSPLPLGPEPKPLCLVGVKACDLRALGVLDFVFQGSEGEPDPFYAKARRDTLIVAADCPNPARPVSAWPSAANPTARRGSTSTFRPSRRAIWSKRALRAAGTYSRNTRTSSNPPTRTRLPSARRPGPGPAAGFGTTWKRGGAPSVRA